MSVKLARIKAGLTQLKFRELLVKEYGVSISPITIVAMEKGEYSNLKHSVMIAIAKALNTSVQELFFTEE